MKYNHYLTRRSRRRGFGGQTDEPKPLRDGDCDRRRLDAKEGGPAAEGQAEECEGQEGDDRQGTGSPH